MVIIKLVAIQPLTKRRIVDKRLDEELIRNKRPTTMRMYPGALPEDKVHAIIGQAEPLGARLKLDILLPETIQATVPLKRK